MQISHKDLTQTTKSYWQKITRLPFIRRTQELTVTYDRILRDKKNLNPVSKRKIFEDNSHPYTRRSLNTLKLLKIKTGMYGRDDIKYMGKKT